MQCHSTRLVAILTPFEGWYVTLIEKMVRHYTLQLFTHRQTSEFCKFFLHELHNFIFYWTFTDYWNLQLIFVEIGNQSENSLALRNRCIHKSLMESDHPSSAHKLIFKITNYTNLLACEHFNGWKSTKHRNGRKMKTLLSRRLCNLKAHKSAVHLLHPTKPANYSATAFTLEWQS